MDIHEEEIPDYFGDDLDPVRVHSPSTDNLFSNRDGKGLLDYDGLARPPSTSYVDAFPPFTIYIEERWLLIS